MDTQRRGPRPSPIRTAYSLQGFPKSASRAAHSPLSSASMTPRSLPSLASAVESLDQRGGLPDGLPRCLPTIAERPEQPASGRRPLPAAPPRPGPAASPPPSPRDTSWSLPAQTLADEARSLLLSAGPAPSQGTAPASVPASRRRSLPTAPTATPLNRRRNSYAIREHLRAWGHVYFGNAPSADCFVVPVALRRHSTAAPRAERGDTSSSVARTDRATVRVRIRPRALDRRPFVLQRTFDLDELRATVPEPSSAGASGRRFSADLSPGMRVSSRRRRSTAGPGADPRSPASPERGPILAANVLPMHLQYARAHLPVLAALILSGHVRQGDIVDLPMPHPEAWPQTVAFIYTGQGELTEAVKQNIRCLGGKP